MFEELNHGTATATPVGFCRSRPGLRPQADYDATIAGYRDLNRFAVEGGATIPLLQSALTVIHMKNLAYTEYANGWMLAQTLQWS